MTSAAYSSTLGVPLAYAWLPAELTIPGTPVQIGGSTGATRPW